MVALNSKKHKNSTGCWVQRINRNSPSFMILDCWIFYLFLLLYFQRRQISVTLRNTRHNPRHWDSKRSCMCSKETKLENNWYTSLLYMYLIYRSHNTSTRLLYVTLWVYESTYNSSTFIDGKLLLYVSARLTNVVDIPDFKCHVGGCSVHCSILKPSTHVECPFGRQLYFWGVLGHFTKMCFAKFPSFRVKAFPRTACHKIHWLQFAYRDIGRLQSWHFSKHFQIPITPKILTLQLWLGTDCNFGLASTTICERGFSKQNWVKSDRKSRLKLETFDALMRVSLCGLLKRIWIRLES